MNQEFTLFDKEIEGGVPEMQVAGKWAHFIGWVFIVLAAITLLAYILLLCNENTIASRLMKISNMSEETAQIVLTGGNIVLGLVMLVAVAIMALNAYWLIQFKRAVFNFSLSGRELDFTKMMEYLTKYLKITLILGALSLGVSLLSVLFSFE